MSELYYCSIFIKFPNYVWLLAKLVEPQKTESSLFYGYEKVNVIKREFHLFLHNFYMIKCFRGKQNQFHVIFWINILSQEHHSGGDRDQMPSVINEFKSYITEE